MEGDQIRRLRRHLGWRQADLADFLALPGHRYISKLERDCTGQRELTRMCLQVLERACRATPPERRRELQRRPAEHLLDWFSRVVARGAST